LKRRISAAVVGVVVVLVVAVATAPFIVPDAFLKQRVADEIARLTGRAVTISGGVNLSIYPNVTATVDGLSIANPEGMGADPFILADGLQARVRLLPLLLARVEFDEFNLINPRIHLVVTADGSNWHFDGRSAIGAVAASAPTGAPGIAGDDVRIGHLRVTNGTIVYDDLTGDRREEMAGVDLDIAWPSAVSAVGGRGTLQWRGETVEFTALVGAPLELMRGGTSQARFAVASTPLRASFSGTATGLETLQLAGDTSFSTPSLRRTLEWFGTPMGAGSILGAAAINGTATITTRAIQFDHAAMELDGNTAEGVLALSFEGARPTVQGTIATEKLDLSPYLEAAHADLTGTGPWLTAPARVDFAKALATDLRISAGQVIAGSLQLGKTAASISTNGNGLNVTIGDAELYGGKLTAQIVTRAADKDLFGQMHVAVVDMPAAALANVAGITALDGTMNATFDLASGGRIWGSFANGVKGTGTLTIANGTLKGVDVAGLADTFADPLAEPVDAGSGSTAFSRLQSTFTVALGRLSTKDLRLEGDGWAVALTGSGSVLNSGVEAKATLTKGAAEVPLAITGSWREPTIARDTPPPGSDLPSPPAGMEIHLPTGG
jgi:AsmA protein